MENPEKIVVYGTKWCPDSHRAHLILKKNKVDYISIDINIDKEAAKIVTELNNGNRSVPTILFPDGSMMVEPSNRELKEKLAELQLII